MKLNFKEMSWNRKIYLSLLLFMVFGIFGIRTMARQGTVPGVKAGPSGTPVAVSVAAVSSDQLSTEESKKGQRRANTVSLVSDEIEQLSDEVLQEKPAWRKPLDDLIESGRAGRDPSAAIVALLSAEPGMGDR